MKQLVRLASGFAILSLVFTGAAVASDEVTLEGSFVWARDDGDLTGDLTAIMTPEGEGGEKWSVAFHFVWEEKPHVYLGTASGGLDKGPLTGTAESDDPENRILFRFSGDVKDGTFTGTHGFVQKDGTLKDGGSLTLARTD